jgi:hypothetical protein
MFKTKINNHNKENFDNKMNLLNKIVPPSEESMEFELTNLSLIK